MLTFAFCTYNRANRLDKLVAAMRNQVCPLPFGILAVNNNSTDNTAEVLQQLQKQYGGILRVATESRQGIVPARNRVIEESLDSAILVFIDDDELPLPGLLAAACNAIQDEGAGCAGGRVRVDFESHGRPKWLTDELLGFLAEVDHGDQPFWIRNTDTPIWTANIAYDVRLFRENPNLRFDQRYNREGANVGGGEDAIMLRSLLERGANIRYRPDMAVKHFVEPWRLRRNYFLKLHYQAGTRYGRYQVPEYSNTLFGIPPFLATQCLKQAFKAASQFISGRPALRQAMNAAHAAGTLAGYAQRTRMGGGE